MRSKTNCCNCGAPVCSSRNSCEYCGTPYESERVVIDIYSMPERPDISRKLAEALANNLKKGMVYYGS